MQFLMFSVVLLINFFGYSQQADWSYDSESQWPGACKVGVSQSPININTNTAILDKHGVHIRGPLQMRGYDDVDMDATNNGHTLKWMVKSDPAPVLSGGPLRSNYTLLQFHLHWLSEHAIDSLKYPMEIHMVHIKYGLTVDEAVELPDGLAVVAVLCQVDSNVTSQFSIQQLMHSIPFLMSQSKKPMRAGYIDISNFISPNPQSYYTYHGSLTTPDCHESVIWIVMDKPVFISDDQYKLITRVDVGGSQNYRSLQAVNRVVYRSTATCFSLTVPNFIFAFSTVLSCLSLNVMSGVTNAVCKIAAFKKNFLGSKSKICEKAIH